MDSDDDMDMFDAFNSEAAVNIRKNSNIEPDKTYKRSHDLLQLASSDNVDELKAKILKLDDQKAANQESRLTNEPLTMPKNPAKVYPFTLDTFQLEAINYIEKGESVLVAAHTSAGKTVTAEYAIAKSLRDGQRVIYTSPIKALSNQKYRDLQEEFQDVGLMTGDMTINPSATCLIMTTEILRSMLYKGSEVMRQVAWVIYDEVHYMRDKERGVVWEESIILLPHKVRFVFLSATIPNAKEFVGWISKLHNQPCHVVYTDYRPVPLQHFVFPAGADGLYLVVDDKSRFKEDSFQKAMSILQGGNGTGVNSDSMIDSKKDNRKSKKKATDSTKTDLVKIVRLIIEKELDPCIIFSFSKKDCELYAMMMARFDFNSDDEKDLVEQVFSNAMESLSEDDQTLPQIATILPLLKRGVGIHHGGLLPILKEIIEILFGEGLIKCLFATETFSIGINMPAKTVVFTKTRKFDGQEFRWITSGEYIQMSGRAGRRGKDDRGNVIQMLDEKMEPAVAKAMIYGASDPLFSSYKVGYNMVLNMLRVEDADPENLLRSSFHQYQQEQAAPELERQAHELLQQAQLITFDSPVTTTDSSVASGSSALTNKNENEKKNSTDSITHKPLVTENMLSEYYTCLQLYKKVQADMYKVILQPENVLPFLNSGRVLRVSAYGVDWGYGVLVNHRNLSGPDIKGFAIGVDDGKVPADGYILDVLLNVKDKNSINNSSVTGTGSGNSSSTSIDVNSSSSTSAEDDDNPTIPALFTDKASTMIVIRVALRSVCELSQVRLTLPKDISKETTRRGVQNMIREIFRRLQNTAQTTSATTTTTTAKPAIKNESNKSNNSSNSNTNNSNSNSGGSKADGSHVTLPQLDPITDIGITEPSFKLLHTRSLELKSRLESSALHHYEPVIEREALLTKFVNKLELLERSKLLLDQSKQSQTVAMKENLKKMKRVLRRMDFISAEGVLGIKGRFSCELSIADELVLSEMVFEGAFNELSVEQCVALLSSFVHSESSKDSVVNINTIRPTNMQTAYKKLQEIARNIAKISIECKIEGIDEEEYANSFSPDMMEVAYEWAKGAKFSEICKLTDIFEGSIIRVLRRLEELLRQMSSAALAIGNMELKTTFESGATAIRRGVVFAASLYV